MLPVLSGSKNSVFTLLNLCCLGWSCLYKIPASGWFFVSKLHWSLVICSLKNRHFHHLQKKQSQRLQHFSVRSKRLTYSSPQKQNQARPARLSTVGCARGEMLLYLTVSKEFVCGDCAASIYSSSEWMTDVSASGCLGVLQPPPSGHPLFPMYLGEPAGAHCGSEKEQG